MRNQIANNIVLNRRSISLRGSGFRKVEMDKKRESLFDDYVSPKTTKPIKIRGGSIEGIDQIRNKMENLKIKPQKEFKNIKFSI